MRRGTVLLGLVILLIGVVLYGASTIFTTLNTISVSGTLNPGQEVSQPYNFQEASIVVKTTPPVPIEIESNGNLIGTFFVDGIMVALSQGGNQVVLINNTSVPLKVTLHIMNAGTSILVFGIMALLGIALGAVGLIVTILGLLRKPQQSA
ncbi:hypothetical protein [Metallosphaera hakonensis]|uniref:Uncharacterized protein n=1 Tax=Metallosphaera hakonensis JCM 8857 = DSM 7519 TaxID=1293036 RepID=A0A2U9IR43_9CREN|nr:hypothetical protein [Metallosphaera hakonensis]AWR98453.1 hypothetical protein DFR87_00570 [Metallosphaera hakonensis JCM 8857 = DSM 7519]